jgi:hypothetical protein
MFPTDAPHAKLKEKTELTPESEGTSGPNPVDDDWYDGIDPEFQDAYEDYMREEAEIEAEREYDEWVARLDKQTVYYPKHEFMVDELFPLNELHIIAGFSGGGKSTWLYCMIYDWIHKKDILGHKSTRYPFCVLINDRSKAGTLRTFERLGLNPNFFPLADKVRLPGTTLVEKIKNLKKQNPALRVIFVEGLHIGLADTNDYGATSAVLEELNALCQNERIMIAGTTHIAKAIGDNEDRTAILGSVAAGAMAETVIVMKPIKGDLVKQIIHPRNEAKIELFYRWTPDGKLEPTDPPGELPKARFAEFLSQPDSATFHRSDVLAFYAEKRGKGARGWSDNTADRDIKKALLDGWIAPNVDDRTQKPIPGSYRRLKVPDGMEASP